MPALELVIIALQMGFKFALVAFKLFRELFVPSEIGSPLIQARLFKIQNLAFDSFHLDFKGRQLLREHIILLKVSLFVPVG